MSNKINAITFGNAFPLHEKFDREESEHWETRCAVCFKELDDKARTIHVDESQNIVTQSEAEAAWAKHLTATAFLIGSTCVKKFAREVVNA
jgi:hypothetical protein